ncbi:hypothetical protein BDQ17DRAFT_1548458 [Cyathus striatus]|nr:hypothetical protein BDQ17DRAFT_1548458 [Cyathus striatus]
MLSQSDINFIVQVPEHIIVEFCSYAYQSDFIASNPGLFHTRHRVNVSTLQAFISQWYESQWPVTVKREKDFIDLTKPTPRTHIVQENGQEVVEIYSSCDEEAENSDPASESENSENSHMDLDSDCESSEDRHMDLDATDNSQVYTDEYSSHSSEDNDVKTIKLEYNEGKPISITKQAKVEVVEYLRGIPTAWPVPECPTAYVLDLTDERYNLQDKVGQQYSADTLIKNKMDSWGGTNGRADSFSWVFNVLGSSEVACHHSHLTCRGIWVCECADAKLINVTCHELDQDANRSLIQAQVAAHREEGSTPISAAIVVTVGCIYTNGQDRAYYKRLFDEFQDIVLQLTSKPLHFKRLVRGGNLLCMNADLEAAQALGFGDSIISTNDPEYSGIPANTDSETILFYIFKGCHTHIKRAVNEFRHLVPYNDYQCLMNFPYMKREELPEFDKFVKSLKNKKISAWWKHKCHSKWILPTIMESMSRMHPDDWRVASSTTNVGEAQHHWTNLQTGVKLTLVDAIKKACEVDQEMSSKIRETLETGFAENESSKIQQKILNEQLAHKESQQREADMKETLHSMQSSISPTKKRAARNAAAPYYTGNHNDASSDEAITQASSPSAPLATTSALSQLAPIPLPSTTILQATVSPSPSVPTAVHGYREDLILSLGSLSTFCMVPEPALTPLGDTITTTFSASAQPLLCDIRNTMTNDGPRDIPEESAVTTAYMLQKDHIQLPSPPAMQLLLPTESPQSPLQLPSPPATQVAAGAPRCDPVPALTLDEVDEVFERFSSNIQIPRP